MANEFVQTMADARVDARSLSEFMFKPVNSMVSRRLAPSIHTLNYYLNLFDTVAAEGAAMMNQAIINSGFIPVGTFAGGATLSKPNDVLKASDDKLYRWAGDLPKTVSSGSTPESTGGFGSNAWLEVSDASLAQKLAGLGGASNIGDALSVYNDLDVFKVSESLVKKGSLVYLQQVYQGGDLEGEGRIYRYQDSATSNAVNIPTDNGYLSREFDGKIFAAEFGANPDDAYGTLDALRSAFELVRVHNGAILSMGSKCVHRFAKPPEDAGLRAHVLAHCSNLIWEFNDCTVYVGFAVFAWQPTAAEYRNHENIIIRGGTFIGTQELIDYDGKPLLKFDIVHGHNIHITDCTFQELIHTGHYFDAMGCTECHFKRNHIIGSNLTDTKDYTEAFQLSSSTRSSYGGSIESFTLLEYFAGLPCRDVFFENNLFEPLYNLDGSIKSYPPRPIAEHLNADGYNINIINNRFINITPLNNYTGPMTAAVIGFEASKVAIRNNYFYSDNTSPNISMLALYGKNTLSNEEGFDDYYIVENNVIDVKPKSLDSVGVFNIISFIYNDATSGSTNQVVDITVKNNQIRLDTSSLVPSAIADSLGKGARILYFSPRVAKSNITISDNNIVGKGFIAEIVNFEDNAKQTNMHVMINDNYIEAKEVPGTVFRSFPSPNLIDYNFICSNNTVNGFNRLGLLSAKGKYYFYNNRFLKGSYKVIGDNTFLVSSNNLSFSGAVNLSDIVMSGNVFEHAGANVTPLTYSTTAKVITPQPNEFVLRLPVE